MIVSSIQEPRVSREDESLPAGGAKPLPPYGGPWGMPAGLDGFGLKAVTVARVRSGMSRGCLDDGEAFFSGAPPHGGNDER